MAENENAPDTHQPADEPTNVSSAGAAAVPAAPAVVKTRWRDRAWSFRAVLTVAAASLIIGGFGGMVVGHHHRPDGRGDRGMFGRHFGDRGGYGGWNGGGYGGGPGMMQRGGNGYGVVPPGGQPGQILPGTPGAPGLPTTPTPSASVKG